MNAMFLGKLVQPQTENDWRGLLSSLPDWNVECLQKVPRQKHGTTLKKHQIDKVEQLVKNFKEGRNSFVADEMDLGKTLTVLMVLHNIPRISYFTYSSTFNWLNSGWNPFLNFMSLTMY